MFLGPSRYCYWTLTYKEGMFTDGRDVGRCQRCFYIEVEVSLFFIVMPDFAPEVTDLIKCTSHQTI